MDLTLETLVLERTSSDFPNRPWRFHGEPVSHMKAMRTDQEMCGSTGVDVAPTPDVFTELVAKLMHARLTNTNGGKIDKEYNHC